MSIICCKNYLILILNLFNLIDGLHQADTPQEDHRDAHKEDKVHIGQALSCTSGGSSEEHGGGTAYGGAHGGTSRGRDGR